MKGGDVRAWRETHNLTRPEMCKLVGPPLTVAKLAGIETGRDLRYDEQQALEAAIGTTDGRLALPDGDVPVAKSAKSDPAKWTAENPSYAARLDEVIGSLKGPKIRGRVATYDIKSRFTKTEEWNGFKRGDTVRVRGVNYAEHGKSNWEKGSFVFLFHVINPENGDEWVDIRGGYGGRMISRSVTVDRVVAAPKRRKKATQ